MIDVDDQHLVARWGGGEFIVVAVGLTAHEPFAVAENLRQQVEATPLALAPDQMIPVTVSAGCAIGTLASFPATMGAADKALYDAKRSGRNRVVVASSFVNQASNSSER